MHDTTTGRKPPICHLVRLMRPKQWLKNAFVLAPLMFTSAFLDADSLRAAALAALLFCLASSSVYIVNDIRDIEHDRRHSGKSATRPLASGAISIRAAILLLCVLYAALAAGCFFIPSVITAIAAYLFLNLAYSFVLKSLPVFDIFCIAAGFVLRVLAGADALGVPLSPWMFITSLCLALYLAAVKRRQELARSGADGRKVLERYSIELIDRYAEMSATGALVFYSLFVVSARPQLAITVPLVLFGLFRYWYVVDALDGGESPTEALISDKVLFLTVLLWIAACVWILWPA
ncbi:MAG: decaprenyl-phosphate phosphoribosyltransferase [Candidatus Accumulibacter sp.]|nr:decaprenyl-phosphate phosphoribosyltransferase [Accumulibacter sp.]